jgi:anti-sigma factor RsiW
MAQDPNKFDPKESTEAKLCAYVDGDLDAAGRAEIEKYLETNPQHRKLLEELKQTRQLMQALPRASAPPEIGEMLQGQLERSLLLNELDTEPAVDSMRISRAAQFRAVAAVILLALGLGAVVYFVLPSSNQRVAVVPPPSVDHERELTSSSTQIVPEFEDSSRTIAGVPAAVAAPTPSAGPATSPAPTVLAEADPFSRRDVDRAKGYAGKGGEVFVRREAKTKAGEVSGGAMPQVAGTAGAGAVQQQQQIDPFRSRVQQTIANVSQAEGQLPGNYTCVVVSTPDPAATKERVNTFLVSNKIQWQPVEEPMPQPIQFGQSQVAMTSRLNQTSVQLRKAGDAYGQSTIYFNNSKVASNGWPQSPGTQMLVNSVPTTGPTATQYRMQASTQSADLGVAEKQSAPAQRIEQTLSQQPTTDEQQIAQAAQPLELKQGFFDSSEQYIVARNMTIEQTVELKDLLARETGAESIEIFDAMPHGQIAATQSVQTQQPLEDLKDSLATTEAFVDVANRIGGADKTAKSEPEAAALAPATQPIGEFANAPATQLLAMQKKLQKESATQPSTQADRLTLQPSTKPTQDVVIVLRNDTTMTPVANQAPATLPASDTVQIAEPPGQAAATPATAPTAPATTQATP